ncbi:carbohydrate ABC transporter permease [Anaerosporobacter sp.]|uniref:carbohydrate ABC transporter permease n=1 Tax=Anaerosporobacter sp. TaxID=1872529 RepID=UPI00286F8CA3|nr:carbohydrate ABC transporter permease [Anaerosporobacter sp.]
MKNKRKSSLNKYTGFDIFLAVFFLIIVFITLYPFLNVLAISFNDSLDTIKGVNFIIPRKFTLDNYKYVFEKKDLLSPLTMSVARTVVGTVIGTICTAMLAYVLSRRDFYFNKLFTIMFIITMYVGGGLIPDYLLIGRTLKMTNKFSVYIIPGLIGVFFLILMRSFIEGLPEALQESARIDGASDFRIWYKIILPLCKPVLATVALFIAVSQWNSFMDTYIYARKMKTLQYVLYEVLNESSIKVSNIHDTTNLQNAIGNVTPQSIRMAITIIATIPIVVVYPFLQKYFVGGMTLGAVKD